MTTLTHAALFALAIFAIIALAVALGRWIAPDVTVEPQRHLRADVTPEAVVALRSAADNLPLGRPGQPWEGAADWLRRRADGFESALGGSDV